MTPFVGRFAELRQLDQAWADVTRAAKAPVGEDGKAGIGRCVLMSGPGGVGKTRLIGEFLRRTGARAFFFAASDTPDSSPKAPGASRRLPADATERLLAAFAAEAAGSALPKAERFRDILAPDWDTALRLLVESLSGAGGDHTDDAAASEPSVVVIDNVATIVAADRGFAVALRRAWQRSLGATRVLLIVSGRDLGDLPHAIGKDAAAMELAPFDPAETGQVLDLDPLGAFDAHIVTGGHPDIAAQWPTRAGALDAVEAMLQRSPSVFEIRAERQLARQLGPGSQAQALLAATGPDERSRAAIGRVAGLPPASLDRGLKQLVADGLMQVERPRSIRESREARYRISDPYLRLWMRLIAPHAEDIARGRMELVVTDFRARWDTWRRGAMQLLARDAMNRLAGAGQLPGTGAVGGYWNRFEDVRVDLIGTDRADSPKAVTFVGAFNWDATAPFDHFDLGSLIAARTDVPGVTATTPLVAVSLAGSAVGDAVAAVLGPGELMSAWQAQ
jgi:hypothetical protein